MFLEAHNFPRASLSENCSLLRTDNVRGQISEHIFALNEGYCLYIILTIEEALTMWLFFCKVTTMSASNVLQQRHRKCERVGFAPVEKSRFRFFTKELMRRDNLIAHTV